MFLWHRLIKIKNLAGRLLMCHLLNQNACVCMTVCVVGGLVACRSSFFVCDLVAAWCHVTVV